MPEIKYDEQGGILQADKKSGSCDAQKLTESKRRGYTLLEKLVIKNSSIGKIIDADGRYRFRSEPKPKLLRLGVTDRCTAQCSYCPREVVHGRTTGYMDFAVYTKLVDWCQENGVEIIGISLWGEPFLHPRIFDMIEYAFSKKIQVRIATNCIFMTKEMTDRLIDLPLNGIEISIDGTSREEYLAGKQVDMYVKAKENILYLLGRAKEKKSQATFNVHFVDVGNVSFMNRLRYVKFWRKELTGLKCNTSFYYFPHNWAGTRPMLGSMSWLDRNLSRFSLKKPCPYLNGLVVNWDGSVLVCGNNPCDSSYIGNIQTGDILGLYDSEKRFKYIKEQEQGTFNVEGCNVCTINSIYPLLYIKRFLINGLIRIFS